MQDSTTIEGVILPTRDSRTKWDIMVNDHVIQTIQPSRPGHGEAETPSVVLPALCHPHVHLDKAYVLTCNCKVSDNHPDYSDLAPTSGSFAEALTNTSEAKKRYTHDDLHLRGAQLLATSYKHGVTSMRAFVEVDHTTGTKAMGVAAQLRDEFSHLVEMQICAFAQDPIFSGDHGQQNREAIEGAISASHADIGALGTTPYVEESGEAAMENIEWAIRTALAYNLHLDFHLDYNLDSSDSQPMIYAVLDRLQKHGWLERANSSKTIVIGHCTHLTMLEAAELEHIAQRIKHSGLPIHFVGLPTSDLFMMGRPASGDDSSSRPHCRPRGTLQVLSLIDTYGLSACLGVNNIGNAFTPYGTGDPLQLACWGVGIYQAGTAADASTLYSCVSWGARKAIGLDVAHANGDVDEGDRWRPMLLVKNPRYIIEAGSTAGSEGLQVRARSRYDFKDIVWDPPESHLRTIVG